MSDPSYWRSLLAWACNLGMLVFGLVFALLGVTLPFFFERDIINAVEAGALISSMTLAALLVTVASGPIFDHYGFRLVLSLSALAAAAGLGLLSQANNLLSLLIGSLLIGAGGGGLNAATNALVARIYPASSGVALNRLGIFFGLGTLLAPAAIGFLTSYLTLEFVLLGLASVPVLPGVLYLVLDMPPARTVSTFSIRKTGRLLRAPFLLALFALLFCQSGAEVTLGGWTATVLVDTFGFTPSHSSRVIALYWVAFVVGRFGAASVLRWVDESLVVRIAAAGGSVAGLFVFFSSSAAAAVAGLIAVGFFMAGIFPTVLAQGSKRSREFSGTVVSGQVAAGWIGGMTISASSGLFVDAFGLKQVLLIPIMGLAAVFLLQTLACRLHRNA